MDLAGVPLCDLDGVPPVAGLDHAVPLLRKNNGGKGTDSLVIFRQQYRLITYRQRLALFGRAERLACFHNTWQVYLHGRALSRLAAYLYIAAALADDSPHRGESQPRALPRHFGRKEGLEQMRLRFGAHARSRVAHR